MCEPLELFNLLNQRRNSVSRLAQSNYLCLFGEKAKTLSHILSPAVCAGI